MDNPGQPGPDQLQLFDAPVEPEKELGTPPRPFSNYIVYVDESGDHSMVSIDDSYPVFVLSLCIFSKNYYVNSVVTALEEFKFRSFGHDIVILHERDIRKETGQFRFSGPQGKESLSGRAIQDHRGEQIHPDNRRHRQEADEG